MVLPPVLDIRRFAIRPSRMSGSSSSSMNSCRLSSSLVDIERQGLPYDDDILSAFPIVMVTSPSRPTMAYPRPRPRLLAKRPEPLRQLPSPPQPDEGSIYSGINGTNNEADDEVEKIFVDYF